MQVVQGEAGEKGNADGHLAAQESDDQPMRVKKRDGVYEAVDLNKIVSAVRGCAKGLTQVDPMRVATRTVGGLYDGATTRELDQLSIEIAAQLTFKQPEYSKLAGRLMARYIDEEVRVQGISCFADAIAVGHKQGLIADDAADFVARHADALNAAIRAERSDLFEYFGIRTLYDRYLIRHPESRDVVETPQYFFMRVACGVSDTLSDVVELYNLFSQLEYVPSSPTLFNSATHRQQLSSCFLLDSPEDDLRAIYDKYLDVALLSKYAGGIGLSFSRIRSEGALIRGTNGHSSGIVPFLKTLDASVAAVNQGGKRKGACCVYLEPWHSDVESFLELRDNTGDEARRTHNLNLANWVPDIFMRRVQEDADWSLFDPKDVPEFPDLFGEAFEAAYVEAEKKGLARKTVKARELYGRMMKTLAQTGNGWMCFKDASNNKCNQTAKPGHAVHLSNLCTEILEVNNSQETAVCNLGSINLSRHVNSDGFDFTKLGETVRIAVRQLDRVIDRNLYAIDSAKRSNMKWRPIGLGMMGLQDVFFQLRLPFDSEQALAVARQISEAVYFHAVSESCALAEEKGRFAAYEESRIAQGQLQFDLWGVTPSEAHDWKGLRARVKEHGVRNSLLIAIAPTATIASISGCYECIEPQVSNLFKRETLSGEFLQVNKYLVRDLQARGLWTDEVRQAIKIGEGSIQGIKQIPEDLQVLYRTAWELPQKALLEQAAARGPFIDQSQSTNLFVESPNIGRLSSMYFFAWQQGLKTTYYLRSRPATRIAKTTVGSKTEAAEAVACSLENPEYCEACQ